MNRFLIFFLFALFVIYTNCQNKPEYQTEEIYNVEVISIKKTSANQWDFNDFFEVEKCIVLDSRIIIGDINKIIFHDGHIFILDTKQKAVFKFSYEGELKERYFSFGKGPKEYTDITDFTIDKESGDVIMLDGVVGKELIKYDNKGNFIKKYKIPFGSANFHQLDEGYIFYCGNHRSSENGLNDNYFYNIVVTDEKFNVIDKMAPISSIWDGRRYIFKNITAFSQYGNSVFFQMPMPNDNTVFEVKDNSVQPKYRFDFGNDNLANLLQESKSLKEIISKIDESSLAHNLNGYFENEKIIYFAILKGDVVQQIVYDKSDKKVFYRDLSLDQLQNFFMPTEYYGDGTFLIHILLPFMVSGHELESYLPESIGTNDINNGSSILVFVKIKDLN